MFNEQTIKFLLIAVPVVRDILIYTLIFGISLSVFLHIKIWFLNHCEIDDNDKE